MDPTLVPWVADSRPGHLQISPSNFVQIMRVFLVDFELPLKLHKPDQPRGPDRGPESIQSFFKLGSGLV